MCGAITAHLASVRSLAYRCPSRSYFRRVISVHILCLDDCFTTTIMPQPSEITQFIFGQPLSRRSGLPDENLVGGGADQHRGRHGYHDSGAPNSSLKLSASRADLSLILQSRP